MSTPPTEFRTLAFGDLERTVWGAAWISDPDGPAVTALGDGGEQTAIANATLAGGTDDGEWRLDGDGAALVISAAGDPVTVQPTDDRVEGFDQLCRVTGAYKLDGAERSVDCLGLRTSRSGGFDLAKLESIRAVSTWFEPDEGFALVAFRGRKAKSHDSDVVTAAVLGPERTPPVEDPRLSTTYGTGGWPVRAGIELWLSGEGEQEQFPRRAAGEAAGARAEASLGGLDIRAAPFRWHSRGRDGAGLYLLARRT